MHLHIFALLLILNASIVLICKSLWIKASAKLLNVNVNVNYKDNYNNNYISIQTIAKCSISDEMPKPGPKLAHDDLQFGLPCHIML